MIKIYIAVALTVIMVAFHNCVPGSSGSSSNATGAGGNGGTVIPQCQYTSNPAPVLEGIFSDAAFTAPASTISYRIGMGGDAGTEGTRTLYLKANSGDGISNVISVNCNGGNGLNTNCDVSNGTLRVRINADQDAECMTGSTTVRITVSDSVNGAGCTALAATSNQLNLTVNFANGCYPQTRLNPPTPFASGQMGANVAIDGNWAVSATPGDEAGGIDAGAAHVFQLNGNVWSNFQRIVPSSLASGSQLGAVAISGNTMVLGANLYANAVGRVWVYTFNGSSWVLTAELNSPSPTVGEKFGTAVAISNGVVAVGAPRNSVSGAQSGAVYLFSGASYATVQTVYPQVVGSETLVQGEFGSSVALESGTLIVGAPFPNSATVRGEAVYIYRQSGAFAFAQKIINTDGGGSKRFGTAVSLSGNRLIIGAPFYSSQNNSEVGRAYVYTRASAAVNYGATFGMLNPGDAGLKDHFGQSVFINANNAFVGAPDKTFDQLAKVGAVYMYNSAGTQTFKIRSRRADRENDSFGQSIAVGNGWLISGAFNDEHDINFLNSGSVYMVDIP
ncbi:MAG: hypothetical protein A4S09_15895 [Proteobacteria bacterium SG_bin7]|nr:MAG: hypothetical protein A4S09_15895 [Proteobacteria bacterium SG_bin7]